MFLLMTTVRRRLNILSLIGVDFALGAFLVIIIVKNEGSPVSCINNCKGPSVLKYVLVLMTFAVFNSS